MALSRRSHGRRRKQRQSRHGWPSAGAARWRVRDFSHGWSYASARACERRHGDRGTWRPDTRCDSDVQPGELGQHHVGTATWSAAGSIEHYGSEQADYGSEWEPNDLPRNLGAVATFQPNDTPRARRPDPLDSGAVKGAYPHKGQPSRTYGLCPRQLANLSPNSDDDDGNTVAPPGLSANARQTAAH